MAEQKFTGEAVRKLFVSSLDRNITDEGLKEYFEKFGGISDYTVIKDSEGSSKGYGFITFNDIDGADTCLESRPHNIGSREAQVKHSIPRDDESSTSGVKTNKIFIGGIKNNTEEEIKEYFENPAFRLVVKNVDVKKDRETNVNRGFGFITLETDDMADKVHIVRRIDEKKWDVFKAEPREGGVGGGAPRGGRGAPRGRGRGGSGYEQRRGGYGGGGGGQYSSGGYDGYNSGYSDGYGGGGYDNYGGYSGSGGYGGGSYGGGYGGGGYGGGSYGGGSYGGGYDSYGGPPRETRGRRGRPY